jgi:hypothetical protein
MSPRNRSCRGAPRLTVTPARARLFTSRTVTVQFGLIGSTERLPLDKAIPSRRPPRLATCTRSYRGGGATFPVPRRVASSNRLLELCLRGPTHKMPVPWATNATPTSVRMATRIGVR